MNAESHELAHERDFGTFVNYSPLRVDWLRQEPWGRHWPLSLWRVDVWEYEGNPKRNLTYVLPREFGLSDGTRLPAGTWIQPKYHLITDFGSIPPLFHALPSLSRTRFIGPYLIHDTGCRYGGVWIKRPDESCCHFVRISRLDADRLLRQSIGAYPWCGNAGQRAAIYAGVRVGATASHSG